MAIYSQYHPYSAQTGGVQNVPGYMPGRPRARGGALAPIVTYTPSGAARQPGFFNPTNPYDTGRSGETNKESNKGQGGKVDWWDYDKGAPKAGYGGLTAEGYYGSQGEGGGGGGGGGGFDYSYDPILQEFYATAMRDEQGARAKLLESKRRRLIQLGSRSIAEKILGASDPTLASISSDPESTSDFGRVLKQYNDMMRGVDESTSQQNTFWGTGRATGYQAAAYGRQQTEADLLLGAEGDIQSYQDAFDSFLHQLMVERRMAEQEAWMRQMWANLLNPGGGDPAAAGDGSTVYYTPYMYKQDQGLLSGSGTAGYGTSSSSGGGGRGGGGGGYVRQ